MSAKNNFLVDIIIFGGFMIASNPAVTGIAIHEWFSLALAAALLTHLLLHWNWVKTVGLNFFRNLFHVSRFNFVLNILLYLAFIVLILSGILISRSVLPTFGLQAVRSPIWSGLHKLSANLALGLVAVHFAIHWKWVLHTVKSVFSRPARVKDPLPQTNTRAPQAQ